MHHGYRVVILKCPKRVRTLVHYVLYIVSIIIIRSSNTYFTPAIINLVISGFILFIATSSIATYIATSCEVYLVISS